MNTPNGARQAAPEERGSVPDEVMLARAYLSRVADPGCIPLWQLVERVGPVAAAAGIRDGSAPGPVLRATAARALAADPHADLEAAERHGIRLVTPESGEWPHFAFAALHRCATARAARYDAGERTHSESGEPMPPLALWVRGPTATAPAATPETAETSETDRVDLATLGVRSIAIVGSRAASNYGERVTAEFAYRLAASGVVVVSGGAHGIDAAAHRAALAAGAPTVLVSAAGLDRVYPPANRELFARVVETGLLVSESPPGCAPHRHRFLTRNRLIAALGSATLVVEAALRSGAANTAAHTLTLGRPLLVVPGPVTSTMSAGCHELLRRHSDRAVLVSRVEDVLEVVGPIGAEPAVGEPAAPRGGDLRGLLDRLDPTARRVFEGLPGRGTALVADIARRSGVGPVEVIRALPALELAGLVRADGPAYRIAPAVTARHGVRAHRA